MIVAMMMPLMVSCERDDNDDVPLESFVVGKWCTYKMVTTENGVSHTDSLSMTPGMIFYICEIKGGGEAVFSGWYGSLGDTQWYGTPCTYRIKGAEVTLTDGSDWTYDLHFEPSSRNLVHTSSYSSYNGTTRTISIYFAKFAQ